MSDADAVPLAITDSQSLVRHLQRDLKRITESLFLLESLVRVIALVYQTAGLIDDIRAENRHCLSI